MLWQVEWFGEQAVHSFFNWFSWFVNAGGCIAYLLVVYIQQEIGFDVGYLIPAATLLVALVVFLLPRNHYREHPTGEQRGWLRGTGTVVERRSLTGKLSPSRARPTADG